MSIDTSGTWWVGSEPSDIAGFLVAYAPKGYEVHELRLAQCNCGSLAFLLDADDNESVARRTCTSCASEHFICDSGEYWNDAEPERLKCIECGSESTNVGVGFSIYPDRGGIRWLYVGTRCTACGVLGCFAGWKVGTSDSMNLLESV